MKYNTAKLTLGKLGNYPGNFEVNDEEFLFNEISSYDKGSKFLEVGSGTGRETVLMCKSAENVEGEVYFYPETIDQALLQRAVLLYQLNNLKGTKFDNYGNFDAIVVNSSQVTKEALNKILESNNYNKAYFYKLDKDIPLEPKDLSKVGNFTIWGK